MTPWLFWEACQQATEPHSSILLASCCTGTHWHGEASWYRSKFPNIYNPLRAAAATCFMLTFRTTHLRYPVVASTLHMRYNSNSTRTQGQPWDRVPCSWAFGCFSPRCNAHCAEVWSLDSGMMLSDLLYPLVATFISLFPVVVNGNSVWLHCSRYRVCSTDESMMSRAMIRVSLLTPTQLPLELRKQTGLTNTARGAAFEHVCAPHAW